VKKKIIVCYLFTQFDKKKSLQNFIYNYKKFNAGVNHKLLICFKLVNKKDLNFYRTLLNKIKFIEFIDPYNINDYDFGSYRRVAERYSSYTIFFLNSHSYPIKTFWLKKILKHYKNRTIIGTSASYESLLSSLKIKKIYNFVSFIFKLLKYKKNFNVFPNPHLRTSSFLINAKDFLSFTKNKSFRNKDDAWIAESGVNGLTNYFRYKNYKIIIVNSDSQKFYENQWAYSKTYNYLKQNKSLISDKHTRKYLKLSNKERLISQHIVWGDK